MSGQFSLVRSGDVQRQNAIYGVVVTDGSSCFLSSSVLSVLDCPLLAVVRLHVLLEWIRSRFDVITASWAGKEEVSNSIFFNTMKGRRRKRIQFPTMKRRTQTLSVTSFFMPTHCDWRYYVSDCSVPLLWKLQRSKVLLGNVLNTHLGLFQEFMYWNHHKTHTGKINEAMIFNIQKVK